MLIIFDYFWTMELIQKFIHKLRRLEMEKAKQDLNWKVSLHQNTFSDPQLLTLFKLFIKQE